MAKPKIIIPAGLKPRPLREEIVVACALTKYFDCDVEFVERNNNKTPDFKIKNKYWELKTPRGNGKRTVDNLLRDAAKQSQNVIINLQFCKMDQRRVVGKIKSYLAINHHGINQVLIITKTKNVVDIM